MFNSTNITSTTTKSMKGTPYWMDPKDILQTRHSFSSDIWSFGCTMIEMGTGTLESTVLRAHA
ncbi:hypothetical protein C5167_048110 [Papaver somniferum]|nr:hypothetical protein C5167_048110 [Papaver somniferum]